MADLDYRPDQWEECLKQINNDFNPWRLDSEFAFSQLAHPEDHFLPGFWPPKKPPVV